MPVPLNAVLVLQLVYFCAPIRVLLSSCLHFPFCSSSFSSSLMNSSSWILDVFLLLFVAIHTHSHPFPEGPPTKKWGSQRRTAEYNQGRSLDWAVFKSHKSGSNVFSSLFNCVYLLWSHLMHKPDLFGQEVAPPYKTDATITQSCGWLDAAPGSKFGDTWLRPKSQVLILPPQKQNTNNRSFIPARHGFIVGKDLVCQFVHKLIKTQVHLREEGWKKQDLEQIWINTDSWYIFSWYILGNLNFPKMIQKFFKKKDTHFGFNFIIEKLLLKLGQSIICTVIVKIQWIKHIPAMKENKSLAFKHSHHLKVPSHSEVHIRQHFGAMHTTLLVLSKASVVLASWWALIIDWMWSFNILRMQS